jgi:hypothetical protein
MREKDSPQMNTKEHEGRKKAPEEMEVSEVPRGSEESEGPQVPDETDGVRRPHPL